MPIPAYVCNGIFEKLQLLVQRRESNLRLRSSGQKNQQKLVQGGKHNLATGPWMCSRI